MRFSLGSVGTLCGMVLALGAAAALGQTGSQGPVGVFSGSTSVTDVSVVLSALDAAGRPITNLRPDELVLREDGKTMHIDALEPLVAPTAPAAAVPTPPAPAAAPAARPAAQPTAAAGRDRLVIYVQADLLTRGQWARAFKQLEASADELALFSPVTVVVADPAPKVVADRIASADALRAELAGLARRRHGRNRVAEVRRRFRRDFEDVSERVHGASGLQIQLVRAANSDEVAIDRDVASRLRRWAAAHSERGGHLLLLVSGGFDLHPMDYYQRFLDTIAPAGQIGLVGEGGIPPEKVSRQSEASVAQMWDELAGELAGGGWTLLAWTGGIGEGNTAISAETRGNERVRSFVGGVPQGPMGDFSTTLLHPLDVLRRAADLSGGAVAVHPAQLEKALARFRSAYVAHYVVNRPPDRAPHKLEVSITRPGATLVYPKVVRSAPPGGDDRARAAELLRTRGSAGDFAVKLQVANVRRVHRKVFSGTLTVTAALGKVLPLITAVNKPAIRVTVAIDAGEKNGPVIAQEPPLPLRLADRAGTWIYEAPIQWSAGSRGLAVVISEPQTDTWGGAVLSTLPTP